MKEPDPRQAKANSEGELPEVRTQVVLALGTAFLALLAVVVVLVGFGRRTEALRTELADLVEPAHAALTDLQRVLALQMAAQRGYRLGGAEESLHTYGDLLVEERQVHARLVPLAHAIGPDATAALAAMRGATARWHEAVERTPSAPPADGLAPRLSTREGYFAAALREADRLGALIEEMAEQRRQTLSGRQRVEDGLIVAMVITAALALFALARVGRRLQTISMEARRMAGIAEKRHDALRASAKEKEAFIRGITHDLKNPLGVIDGSAELLEVGARGEVTSGQREMVQRIRRAAGEMLGIINDVLELSRAEAATLHLKPEEVELNGLIEDTVEHYRTALERNRHTVSVRPAPGDARVTTDPARVREIVGNLLTNAGRHTPAGGSVTVEVHAANGQRGAGGEVAISVADTGPGVPPERREAIFREFNRRSGSEGSGIGLAIGRKLARALGGDLQLEEGAHQGARFTLTLPAGSATPPRDLRTPDTGLR